MGGRTHRRSQYLRQPLLPRIFYEFFFSFFFSPFHPRSMILQTLSRYSPGRWWNVFTWRGRGEGNKKSKRSFRGKEEISRLVWLIAQINCHRFYQPGANLQLPPIINGTASEIASNILCETIAFDARLRIRVGKNVTTVCFAPSNCYCDTVSSCPCRGLLDETRPMSMVFHCRN